MKYNKKKVVIRTIPETNSSSTHSVTIDTQGSLCSPGDEEWNLDIRFEDGKRILYIPEQSGNISNDFSSSYNSNKCLIKILYAYGLSDRNPEARLDIEKVIKEVTGVDEVRFEWIEKARSLVKGNDSLINAKKLINPPILYDDDLKTAEDIFESYETLKDFIFNPKSAIYGGLEDIDEDYYNLYKKGPDEIEGIGILSIYFGGSLGRVDIEIKDYTNSNEQDIPSIIKNSQLLRGLEFNLEKNDFQFNTKYLSRKLPYNNDSDLTLNNMSVVMKENGDFYLVLSNESDSERREYKLELRFDRYGKIF